MNKIALAMGELHRSERRLADDLRAVAARHHSDQDIHHLALDLAAWSDDHIAVLGEHAERQGMRLRTPAIGVRTHRAQRMLSDVLRRRPEPALLLLADLRRIHRVAAGASLDWELLAQGAQAVKNAELLAVTERCHPQTLRQMRWANAMLKELAPQALAS